MDLISYNCLNLIAYFQKYQDNLTINLINFYYYDFNKFMQVFNYFNFHHYWFIANYLILKKEAYKVI